YRPVGRSDFVAVGNLSSCRLGPDQRPYGVGTVLMAAVWQLVLVSVLIGAGIGLAYGAMPALIMSAVPVSETAAANSLNTLMRSIGTSVSSAVAGVILAQLTISLGGYTLP